MSIGAPFLGGEEETDLGLKEKQFDTELVADNEWSVSFC